jgi:MFS family permease
VWRPAVNAALPSLVDADERSAATSAWSLCMNLGMTAGPALSALALLFVDPAVVLGINGLTFAVSAVLLAGVPLGRASGAAASAPTDARRAARVDRSAGVGAAVRVPGVMAMIGVSSGVVLAGAMMNVAEPVLTVGPLHGGASAFGLLAALYGIGMIAGSVWNSRAGSSIGALRGRWLGGIALTGVMLVGSGLAPALPVAAVTFALTGLGNSLVTGSEIRLLQEMSPTRLLGSVFGLYDALQNGAFVVAFAVGGALVTTSGARTVFLIAGIIALSAAALAIRRCRPITDIAAVLPGLEPVADGTPATA